MQTRTTTIPDSSSEVSSFDLNTETIPTDELLDSMVYYGLKFSDHEPNVQDIFCEMFQFSPVILELDHLKSNYLDSKLVISFLYPLQDFIQSRWGDALSHDVSVDAKLTNMVKRHAEIITEGLVKVLRSRTQFEELFKLASDAMNLSKSDFTFYTNVADAMSYIHLINDEIKAARMKFFSFKYATQHQSARSNICETSKMFGLGSSPKPGKLFNVLDAMLNLTANHNKLMKQIDSLPDPSDLVTVQIRHSNFCEAHGKRQSFQVKDDVLNVIHACGTHHVQIDDCTIQLQENHETREIEELFLLSGPFSSINSAGNVRYTINVLTPNFNESKEQLQEFNIHVKSYSLCALYIRRPAITQLISMSKENNLLLSEANMTMTMLLSYIDSNINELTSKFIPTLHYAEKFETIHDFKAYYSTFERLTHSQTNQ